MPTAYCFACGWQRDAEEDELTELGRAMIDHHVETGHGPIEQLRDGEDAAELPGAREVARFCDGDGAPESEPEIGSTAPVGSDDDRDSPAPSDSA